jgi:hypothetical protein
VKLGISHFSQLHRTTFRLVAKNMISSYIILFTLIILDIYRLKRLNKGICRLDEKEAEVYKKLVIAEALLFVPSLALAPFVSQTINGIILFLNYSLFLYSMYYFWRKYYIADTKTR